MSRIRINELARELEVKPSVILKVLPSVGITNKKTHSSSIEQEEADKVRRKLRQPQEEPLKEEAEKPLKEAPAAKAKRPASKTPKKVSPSPATASKKDAPADQAGVQAEVKEAAAPPPTATTGEMENGAPEKVVQSRAPQPLRPPLATGKSAAPPPAPVTAQPPKPKPVTIPAKPIPSPKPGQILSGPRQPLPPGLLDLEHPLPSQPEVKAKQAKPGPAIPRPPVQRRQAPKKAVSKESTGPIVGKPAARPVVPPRPDLVARLSQRPKMPGQPQQRPNYQQRGQHTPVPGQPIYRGPIRPGQPLMRRGPGSPPGARRRPSPYPAAPMEPPTPAPTGLPRRQHGKPNKPLVRERERDREGRLLTPSPRRNQQEAVVAVNKEITISEGITVKELSERLGLKASLVIRKLVDRKIFATINQALDAKLADEISVAFGATASKVSYEEETVQEVEQAEEEKDLIKRAPVVTVMGHVDHGKTSLLDAIRTTSVAEREAGGITQHIGAYRVKAGDNEIVFIDTPGHAAFTRMRARGAEVTDIVVLVVAADDGVMPQTLEAIDHAKAAKVPIIVAINKIDRPDANLDRIKQQLADRDLLAEDWGGQTVMVPVSAKEKTGLNLLLEMIALVADMQDFKANPSRPGVGTVLEAELDKGRGPVATVLVCNGTLKIGDHFICGAVFGRVRAMFDDAGNPITSAEPSVPVEVIGLNALPEVGDTFQVVTDTVKAKQIVIYRESKAREVAMSKGSRITLDKLHEQLKEGDVKELNVIIKTDVGGTAEVISDALQKLSNDKVRIQVIRSGVGAITESDVLLATTSNGIIIGFNVRPERSAIQLAEHENVDIRLHTVIYELTEELEHAMTGMLEPVFKEVYRGRAEILEIFRISKIGTIAGCMVKDGILSRDSQVRLLRDNIVIHTGKIGSLKRFKDDVSEVKTNFECGVALEKFNDLKPGDIIEAFVVERMKSEALA